MPEARTGYADRAHLRATPAAPHHLEGTMLRHLASTVLLAALLVLLAAMAPAARAAEVLRADLDGSVDPGSAAHLVEAVAEAERSGAEALLVVVDTPGGLVTSARAIVQAELAAKVPVIVWVGPAGARAGSAGVFVTLAAHLAAMAPGTTIGAAHPVSLFGGLGDPGGDPGQGEAPDAGSKSGDEVMGEKILNDTLAWVRAIAEERGRDVAWAESAVRDSAAITAREALEQGVIDLLAPDPDALLAAADGRVVQVDGRARTLRTRGATIRPFPMSGRQRLVHLLGDPNLLFAFIGLGLLGLYVEFHNPGLIVPGLVGGALLVAAAVGLSILPFNAGGLLLILVGFAGIALEVWVGGKGLFAVIGGLCVAGGGALLFDVAGMDLRVDPTALLSLGALVVLAGVLVGWLVGRAHRRRVATGREAMAGLEARVVEGGEGAGWVLVEGERWRARWSGRHEPGDTLRVVAVRGLELEVEPLPSP